MEDIVLEHSPPHTNKYIKWLSYVTVEPIMFLYMFAFMLTSVVEQVFFVDRACRVNLGFPDKVCSNLHNKTYFDENVKVQVAVSTFYQNHNIVSHIVPIILAFFVGAWSDSRGRKAPLLIGLFGKLLYSGMLALNALEGSWNLDIVLATVSFPSALTGADLVIFACCFSYLSDITTQNDRTLRIAIVDIVYLSSMPTGVALGKYLFAEVVNRSYAAMFTINAVLMIITIIYAFLRLKWRTNPRQTPLPSISGCCCDFFNISHAVETVKCMIRPRKNRRTSCLALLLVSMIFYTFQRDEKPMMYLYTQLKFQWTADTYSDFKTFQTAAYIIGVLLGVPLLGRFLGLKDATIVMTGAAGHAIARFFYAFAQVPWVLYVGATVAAIGPVAAPVIRSMTSKIVPTSERGKVLTLLAVGDSAVPLFSGTIYSQVYNASITTFPSAIFWVTFVSQAIVFVCLIIIILLLNGRPLEVDDMEQLD